MARHLRELRFSSEAGRLTRAFRLLQTGSVRFSVRPQMLKTHSTPATNRAQGCIVEGKVLERAYLGETWDYVVSPTGAPVQLRVSTLPSQIHEVGDNIWIEFDPEQMAIIS